jgi:hypothetical protein
MLRTAAKIFGVVLLAVGVLGFIPALTPDRKLLGIFEVNTVHNLIHLASGAVALYTSMKSELASRKYFQIFGVVYGLVAVLGVFHMEKDLLGIVAHNTADLFLHVLIAGSALYLGFAAKGDDRAQV